MVAVARAQQVKEEDFVANLIIANTHDVLLCFTNLGRVYWLKVYQMPQARRASRGRPIVNILPLRRMKISLRSCR